MIFTALIFVLRHTMCCDCNENQRVGQPLWHGNHVEMAANPGTRLVIASKCCVSLQNALRLRANS